MKEEENLETEGSCAEPAILLKTELPLPLFVRGKTRDVYDLDEQLLIVATDRISAFDVVLPCGIPGKGQVLNQLSAFWFEKIKHIVPNHVLQMVNDVSCLDDYIPQNKRFSYPSYLSGRSMVVKKAERIPIECVVRGFLSGSAWEEYLKRGTVSGVPVIEGLLESNVLPQPLCTPTTKADEGHDMPMSIDEVEHILGAALAEAIRKISIKIYRFALGYARSPASFIIADTKLEFGVDGGKPILIDELLTPDSSRFWDIDSYVAGKHQDSFDKQPVRDWLESSGWNKEPPAPILPVEVIEQTSKRYRQVYEKLTGKKLLLS
jgi:phosphoribosylaminoimidazole-succinocarboxamide synthase